MIGKGLRSKEINRIVSKHHGHTKIVDAFYHQTNLYEHFDKELKDADIVVMVQNYCKHATSKTITSIATKKDKNFAIANSGGLQSIEQAIYRADQGIKSYENSSSTIYYPTKDEA